MDSPRKHRQPSEKEEEEKVASRQSRNHKSCFLKKKAQDTRQDVAVIDRYQASATPPKAPMLETHLKYVFALLLAPCYVLLADEAKLSPHQRAILAAPSPPSQDLSFSFAAPGGPQFTEEEKQAQRERAKDVLPLITKAYESGEAKVRIAPGDYRFGQEYYEGSRVVYPLGFRDMQRDVEHPFEIDASGATFWFDLGDAQMPPGHRCVGFQNCRNIVLRGAVIDRGTRGCIEGQITRIDRNGNRFEIAPSLGIVVPDTYKDGDEQRLLPFKSDGRFCAPLYDLQPGVRKLRYKHITPSGGGKYWVQMHDPDLMDRIQDSHWTEAYGELGVLRVGDGLSCLYTSAGAIALEDSANVTLVGVGVYVAKGGPSEIGGDGAHLWKDCYFGPRPGTSQWKGADGYLCRSTRYGSTLDHVTIRHTADDLQNYHGIWGKVKSTTGNKVTMETNSALRPTLQNVRPGDRLRFMNRKTGVFLGEARIVSLNGFDLTIDCDASRFAEAQASWPDHECAGWVIQNCDWEDNFQRLMIMSGPGMVRNCVFTRMGSGISLNTGMGLVGGIPNDITIKDNTFMDVNPRPLGSAIEARAHNAQGREGIPPIERLVITNNSFLRSGGPALHLAGIRDSRLEDNRVDSAVRATAIARPSYTPPLQAITLRHCTQIEVNGNTVVDLRNNLKPDTTSQSPLLGLSATTNIRLDKNQLADAPEVPQEASSK